MSKGKGSLSVLLLVASGIVATTFQNCGDASSFATSRKMASEDPVEVISIDPGDPHIPMKLIQEAQNEPILADRYYIQSLFEDVFGSTASSADSARLFTNVAVNGSPCSTYEDHRIRNSAGGLVRVNTMEICAIGSPNRTGSQVIPKGTVTRQSMIARACSDLVANATTFGKAIAKISSPGVPEPSEANLKKAFRLFYRNAPEPSQGLLDSLKLLLPEEDVQLDDWRAVLHTICVSPHWQLL